MDYRSSIPDDDQPGASPWGSSPPTSPRRNLDRQNPSFRYEAQESSTSEGFGNDDHNGSPFNPSQSANTSQATTGTSIAPSAESSQQEQSDTRSERDYQQPQGPSQDQDQQHEQNYAQNPSSEGDGHEQQNSQRRANQPQYKLQAKITGLERTGRKDPILRFDVHVSTTLRIFAHFASSFSRSGFQG